LGFRLGGPCVVLRDGVGAWGRVFQPASNDALASEPSGRIGCLASTSLLPS